jgi:hypothetical protein
MFYLTFLAQLSLLAQLPIYKSEIKSGITSIQSRYDESICTGLKRVEEARKQKRWQCQDARWYMDASVSLPVLKRFRAGQSVREEAFIDICKAVGINNWQEIVDHEVQETESPDLSSVSTDLSCARRKFCGRENKARFAALNTSSTAKAQRGHT